MRLLSRNAEALFWLARYLERASSLARVIEMQSSFGRNDEDGGWEWLLTLHTDELRFNERLEPSADTIIAFYLTDNTNPGSIRSSIHWARENARALRPFIPIDMWTQLNTFHANTEEMSAQQIHRSQVPRVCSEIRSGCLAQIGVAEGLLYRDEGYQFFKLGLMIERADQTSRLLDVKFAQSATAARAADSADDFVFWSTILRTVGAYQVFHRLEPDNADSERVARFLTLNQSHPRSIAFCVGEIGDALQMLRSGFQLSASIAPLNAHESLMQGLQAAGQNAGLVEGLHAFNDWVQRALIKLTTEIDTAFFRTTSPDPVDDPGPRQEQTTGHQKPSNSQGQSQTSGRAQS